MYNTSSLDNIESSFAYFQGVNDLTGQWLMMGALVVFFIVMIAVQKHYDTKSVLLGSSFILLVIAITFWASKLIPFWALGVIIFLLALSLILKLLDR